MILNGFTLPIELETFDEKGIRINSEGLITKVLSGKMPYTNGYELYLYNKVCIKRETLALHKDYNNYLNGKLTPELTSSIKYRGQDSEIIFIDLRFLVVIGDLGYDIPLCLDFRDKNKSDDPPILVLDDSFVWVKIVSSFSLFWNSIKSYT